MATVMERPPAAGPERDTLVRSTARSLDEMFAADRAETEQFQLAGARQRFEELIGSLKALRVQAEGAGITAIDTLDDLASLLFEHTTYKSYPISLLEKNRFDLLTKWLGGMTTIDLSGVDASGYESIDDWMALLERETPLRLCHTSGTTGKLSFIPRTAIECDYWCENLLKAWESYRDEPGYKLGGDGDRMPVIYPSVRHGRYVMQRVLAYLANHLAPSPDQVFTMTEGTLSADIASLSGRIRVAQAKGELARLTIGDAMKMAMKRYLEDLERRPQEIAAFFERIFGALSGRRVYIISQSSYLYQAACEGLDRGRSAIFSPDSLGSIGGGSKDVVLPADHRDVISRFTGITIFRDNYGMSELNATMPRCPHGHFHFQPHIIPFLLDVESAAPLPRDGRRAGRFAAFDLTAQSYWGGVRTGDKLTIEWDAPCGCGRKGAYAVGEVSRYAAEVTGDDKISCSATVDNTDTALRQLLDW